MHVVEDFESEAETSNYRLNCNNTDAMAMHIDQPRDPRLLKLYTDAPHSIL